MVFASSATLLTSAYADFDVLHRPVESAKYDIAKIKQWRWIEEI